METVAMNTPVRVGPETATGRTQWGPLVLLLMLCGNRRQPRRPTRRELILPPGCVLAARYSSR